MTRVRSLGNEGGKCPGHLLVEQAQLLHGGGSQLGGGEGWRPGRAERAPRTRPNPPALLCFRRRPKRHPRKSLPRRIRGHRHLISTSASVGSFEGRRHRSDHLTLLLPRSFHFLRGGAGAGRARGGGGAGEIT